VRLVQPFVGEAVQGFEEPVQANFPPSKVEAVLPILAGIIQEVIDPPSGAKVKMPLVVLPETLLEVKERLSRMKPYARTPGIRVHIHPIQGKPFPSRSPKQRRNDALEVKVVPKILIQCPVGPGINAEPRLGEVVPIRERDVLIVAQGKDQMGSPGEDRC
jgi:hypothetical protein